MLLLCMPPPGEAACAEEALNNFRGRALILWDSIVMGWIVILIMVNCWSREFMMFHWFYMGYSLVFAGKWPMENWRVSIMCPCFRWDFPGLPASRGYVAYVGEWGSGMTATSAFHESLLSKFEFLGQSWLSVQGAKVRRGIRMTKSFIDDSLTLFEHRTPPNPPYWYGLIMVNYQHFPVVSLSSLCRTEKFTRARGPGTRVSGYYLDKPGMVLMD